MRGTALGAVVCLTLLAACSGTSGSGEGAGSALGNLVLYGGTAPPPAAPAATSDDIDCPPVDVIEGGAALRTYGGQVGDESRLRGQISIGQLARECAAGPNGSVLVKVGVEARAILGPGGSPGRFEAPVRFVIKVGDRVVDSRSRRVPLSVPPGQTQGSATVVEEGLRVPAGAGEFEILVGLGGSGPESRPARRPRG